MKRPALNALVTLTSGHTVRYLGATETGIRVRSLNLSITYETSAARLPILL